MTRAPAPRSRAAWFLLAFLIGTPAAEASDGEVFYLPLGRTKIENGLRVAVDTRWVSANGYRPVSIELFPWPPGPAPADRTIHVELEFDSWGRGSVASRVIEIPEGSMGVKATLSIPQYANWYGARVKVSEDGRLLRDLSPRDHINLNASYWEWTEGHPSILIIDSDAPGHDLRARRVQQFRQIGSRNTEETHLLPDPHVIASLAPSEQFGLSATVGNSQRMTDAEVLTLVSDHPHLELLPPAELPAGWINYSSLDLILVSFDELELMRTSYPDRLAAIRDWAVAGGSLCVYGVGDDFARLPGLEAALAMAPRAAAADARLIHGWSPADPGYFGERMFEFHDGSNTYTYFGGSVVVSSGSGSSGSAETGVGSPRAKPPEQLPFVERSIGAGRVIALAAEDPFPGDAGVWEWMYNSLSSARLKWYQRHGVSFTRRNADYWNLLVPGVGMPPVASFLILISLFAVAIGPVNYWLLRRSRRLYLLLFTVPAGAALFTFALLVYAVISDGLGASVRVRSYTSIDQRSGETFSWSRQTYYAALIPSGGVRFPEDTAVYPIDLSPDFATKRETVWIDGRQRLASGYIRARTATQFLVVRAARSQSKLEVAERAGEPPTITNRLGGPIQYLVVVDSQGAFHVGTGIDAGHVASLRSARAEDARRELRGLMAEARPQLPPGFDPYRYESDFFLMDFGPRYYFGANRAEDRPTFTTSVLERHLGEISSASSTYPPRTYYAVVETTPEVPLGIPTATQRSSFHVIKGQW